MINKSVEQASNRSLRLLGNYGSTSESRTNTENEDDILTNLESDGEEEKEFEIDALFKIYYKKVTYEVYNFSYYLIVADTYIFILVKSGCFHRERYYFSQKNS